jgi:putative DNA primase/helicase
VLPDIDLQKVLAEGFGYIFIPSKKLKLEKMLVLSGDGSNGKSVSFEVLSALLGPENLSSYSIEKLTTEETHRAKIADKLVNYCSEISVNLEPSMFKALVSGESVPARELYGKPFHIENYAKLIANANKLPTVAEHTHAWFRRFLIVPFNITIPDHEQDTQLANKIIASELPGVLNWVLTGLRRLLIQGHFTDSEAIRTQTELYKRQSDTVRLFLDEYAYQPASDQYTSLQDLYREYQTFCRDDGHRNPVNKLNFRKRIEGFNILTGNRNVGRVVFLSRSQSDTPS